MGDWDGDGERGMRCGVTLSGPQKQNGMATVTDAGTLAARLSHDELCNRWGRTDDDWIEITGRTPRGGFVMTGMHVSDDRQRVVAGPVFAIDSFEDAMRANGSVEWCSGIGAADWPNCFVHYAMYNTTFETHGVALFEFLGLFDNERAVRHVIGQLSGCMSHVFSVAAEIARRGKFVLGKIEEAGKNKTGFAQHNLAENISRLHTYRAENAVASAAAVARAGLTGRNPALWLEAVVEAETGGLTENTAEMLWLMDEDVAETGLAFLRAFSGEREDIQRSILQFIVRANVPETPAQKARAVAKMDERIVGRRR